MTRDAARDVDPNAVDAPDAPPAADEDNNVQEEVKDTKISWKNMDRVSSFFVYQEWTRECSISSLSRWTSI